MLLAWYPLNGDLEDYCGSKNNAINVNATVDNTGKIGKCYTLNGSNYIKTNVGEGLSSENLTISLWARVNTIEDSKILFGTSNGSNQRIYLGVKNGKWAMGYGYNLWESIPTNVADVTNKWTHIVYVSSGASAWFYIDGVKIQTKKVSTPFLLCSNFFLGNNGSSTYNIKASYNDVRIYDEALSLKEIKEVAKAKILHYNFNQFAESSKNIIPNPHIFSSGWTPYSNGNSGSFITEFGTEGLKIENKRSWCGAYRAITLPSVGTYTLSVWVKVISRTNSNIGATLYTSGGGLGDVNVGASWDSSKIGKWQKIQMTRTYTTTSITLYLICYGGNNAEGYEISAQYTMPQIEAKPYSTEFVNGERIDRVVDSSGFRNHSLPLQLATTPQWTEDGIIGSGCYKFNGDNQIVTKQLFFDDKNQEWTVAGWAKLNVNNKTQSVNNFNLSNRLTQTTTQKALLYLNNGTEDSYVYSKTTIPTNEWYHFAFVVRTSDLTCKYYHNGTLDASSSNYTSTDFPLGFFSQTEFGVGLDGYLDDIRIYATALSDNDIKELYQSKGSISKSGKLFVNEIVEIGTTAHINKRGQLTTKEIIETPSVNLETKTAYGADWVQLFYHNNKSGTVLFSSDKKEFLKCNTSDKISNLYLMELFRGKDGKFEFLLEYESGGASYNRWKQTSNFITEPIVGYEAVQCSWTSSYWGGLEPSNNTSTWVDGSVNHSNWFYAIGGRVNYSTGGLPNWNGVEPGWVKIWVRCDNPSVFKMYKNGTVSATEFIEN